MPHKSLAKVRAQRSKKTEDVFKRANAYYKAGVAFERAGKIPQATAAYKQAQKLMKRASRSGMLFGPVGRLPNSPKKKEARTRFSVQAREKLTERWYFNEVKAVSRRAAVAAARKLFPTWRFDSHVANQIGHSPQRNPPLTEWDDSDIEAAIALGHRQGVAGRGYEREQIKFYNVTWYSPKRGKRTGFLRPIAAHNMTDAKRQAKAMIEDEPKGPTNFIAKEVKSNPGNFAFYLSSLTDGELKEYLGVYSKADRTINNKRRLREIMSEIRRRKEDKRQMKEDEQRDRLRGYQGKNPGLIDLAANLQAAQSVKDMIAPKRKRRNPSIKATSQLFQGAANGKVSELKAANSAPRDLARIGRFVFFKLENVRAQTRIPGAVTAVDTRGRLWLCGRAPMFKRKAKPGELLDHGYIDQLCYETTKAHLDGVPTEYVHSFGEDGGKRPRLLVDHEGMPILRGGDYKISADGIVN